MEQLSEFRCSFEFTWSNVVHQLHWRHNSHFSTHSVQYYLYADDTQSYDHCPVAAVPSLLTRLSSCVADLTNRMLLFDCSSLQPKLSSSCLAHVAIGLIIGWMPFLDSLFIGYSLCWCCTRSCCPVEQWDVHAATHWQDYQRMLLSHSEAASDTKLCQSNSHGTACDVTCHHAHWLLQLSSLAFLLYTGAAATSTKCDGSIGA